MNTVLGIETSCDETGIAIYSAKKGLIAHQVYSQIDLHQAYGGVVPELASRDHIRKTLPLIELSLKEAGINKSDLDGIAYTKGPGLIGALMVGASVAKGLAYSLNIPVVGVHHLEAHLMAVMLTDNPPAFPFLTLLVSGGHTLLIAVEKFGSYDIIGESLDDAAGEAFDKTAKLLGLPYPGGPHLAKLAEQGDSSRFTFPRPMLHSKDLNFSFSGLKTHAVTTYRHCEERSDAAIHSYKSDIAAAFEDAVVDVLFKKTKKALEQTGYDRCVVAGGVAANKKLRALFSEKLNAEVFYPPHELCTDNGAMVAYTGYLHLNNNETSDLAVDVFPRLNISSSAPTEPKR